MYLIGHCYPAKTRITKKTYCGEHGKDEAWPCKHIAPLDRLTVALNYWGMLCRKCVGSGLLNPTNDPLEWILRKKDGECYACHGTGVKIPAHLDELLEQAFLDKRLLQDNEKDVTTK